MPKDKTKLACLLRVTYCGMINFLNKISTLGRKNFTTFNYNAVFFKFILVPITYFML